MKVLITGAFGWTAISITQALRQAKHVIIAFDLPASTCPNFTKPLLSKIILGDVANFNQVNNAVQEAEAIVHLAVAVGDNDYQNSDIPFRVNVQGMYNIFEAARRRSVQQIILMSSASVHLHHSGNKKVSALGDCRSDDGEDHLYDLTKCLQEEIAKDFCQTYKMNAITLRAGHIVDGKREVDPTGKPLSMLNYSRGGWVCRYDLAAACVKALELELSGYNAFHVIGALQAKQHFDIERTEKQLGPIFQTRFEQYQ